MRSLALLVVFAIAAIVSSCCPEDPFIAAPIGRDTSIKHPAFLRIVHAAADGPPAGATVGPRQFTAVLPYFTFQAGNEGRYYPADTAWKSVTFAGASGTIASSAIAMEAGKYYTAYLYGRSPDYRVLVTTDTLQPDPANDEMKLRLANLSPGSPRIDIWITSSPNTPIARGISYGEAGSYSIHKVAGLPLPSLIITDTESGDTIMVQQEVPLIIGASVITLVVSGEIEPVCNGPLLTFGAFLSENVRHPTSQLYGGAPLKLDLFALRMMNLLAEPTVDTYIDLAIEDLVNGKGFNNNFRRNYPGMDSVKTLPSLIHPFTRPKGYYFMSAGKSSYVYRIERTSRPWFDPGDQQPISPNDVLSTGVNQRYTIVAYGSPVPGEVRTAELHDNSPCPAAGQARVRFFHGGFGNLADKNLKLRVNTSETGLQVYGQAPTGAMSVDMPSGAVTLEVIDASGTVVHSEAATLVTGKIYTIFLAPHREGTGYVLRPVVDEVTR